METREPQGGNEVKKPLFRDIRRYYCEYCGICRSKKSIIRSHVLAVHKDEVEDAEDEEIEATKKAQHTCQECGATFRKPAYLKQHMQGHSLEAYGIMNDVTMFENKREAFGSHLTNSKMRRPFTCTLEDCHVSYRRKDHLTRHLISHQGKLFVCPIESCNKRFAFQGNMTRHVEEMHDEESSHEGEKLYTCKEVGCGKSFKYPSKLRKHEDSHVKLDYLEVICGEPGCLKMFTNTDCLKAHIKSCHQYVQCEICGTKQLKKNFKRHQRIHEGCDRVERIQCNFEGCQYTFANRSNLNIHVRVVHLELRPFSCRIAGCAQKFPYKHVRDNHEKSGAHVYTQGDFIEADEQWVSRPRGGRKRKPVSVETLMRKRVASAQDSAAGDGNEYLRWLLSDDM